ncbi:single-stranded DNA-binding protein [Beluga whale alphaherpesvirus 1]|uniref:Single-stranded DNA-binding protein n=1 Tax=Beluga whale alphaherpesvirus 1 TaxID=1434720 RepID=A0A286MM51_9ALPH|nr:single-stranded DNA-binding protein [Beluga whale alphaherpesvirus 1]ASW27077.1 single-stranded DNA-binding protein [Beluga whale alphaherpesvirus 1]
MEPATKTVALPPGPAAYVYVCPPGTLDADRCSLLAARSADSDLAVLPLVRGLTVEHAFEANVAVVAGARTTGLGGSGVTFKLASSHFHPNVFVFHGGRAFRPSTAAPNLTRACDNARARFGFSAFRALAEDAVPTTGADICAAAGLSPDGAVVYLATTEAFKEVVFVCNTFIHYGGASVVPLGGGEATRLPVYPLQLFMPDFNRVFTEPFNARHRAIGEDFSYPRPFFNPALCELLHGYVLGPAAVALRVRNVDAVARGFAHLAFDEAHEGAVLPNDVTFTLFDSSSAGARGGARHGARGADPAGGGASHPGGGTERRLASVMAADAAISVVAAVGAGVYEDGPPSVDDWPLLADAADDAEGLRALGAYVARAAGLVGAMVFASNSVLYMTEVDDGGPGDAKEGHATSFNRFYQIAAPYVAGNPQTDKDGRVIPETGGRPHAGVGGGGHEFAVDHLALACGFCPQLLARVLFYLERCDGGAFVGRSDADAVRYLASTLDGDVPCGLCDRDTRPACAHTTLHRLRHRLPRFGPPARVPMAVFGTMNSAYSDCDVLGSYASYGALRRPNDTEPPKTTMQATYRATVESLFSQLDQHNLLTYDAASAARLGGVITGHGSFRAALTTFRELVEQATDAFMRTLVTTRDYKIREALYEANHTLSLSVDPYASALCPATSFLARRSLLALVQDLVLSQCHGVFSGQAVEGRNFRPQFQPVLRRRFMDMLNGGFVTTRTATVTLSDAGVPAPDLRLDQTAPPVRHADGDFARVSVEVFRELRVKNRVMFSAGNANMSEAARARVAGLAGAYQKPEGSVNVLNGPVGFLLKQFHHVLFPNGRPAGGGAPNPQWFWTLLQRNQLPAKMLTAEDVATICAVKRFSDEYAAINYVNVHPNNFAELAQFYMANLILKYCDHRTFFVNSVTAVVAGSRRPCDPSSVVQWIARPLQTADSVAEAAREVLDGVEETPHMWTCTFTSTNVLRVVMATRPMVVLGLGVSKYHGSAGNNRVFQAGNWSGLNGGKNVCPLLCFDRTRRFVIACPRAGFVCPQSTAGAGAKDYTLGEHVQALVAEGGPSVQTAVYAAALHAMGARVQHLTADDWIELVEDEFLAAALVDLNARTAAAEGGWSVEAGLEAVRELEGQLAARGEATETAFDFSACGGDVSFVRPPGPLAGEKRAPVDDLFELATPEKKSAITIDML